MDKRRSSEDLKRKPVKQSAVNDYQRAARTQRNERRARPQADAADSRDIRSHSNDKALDLMSRSTKAKKKKANVKLIVANVLLSIALVFSTLCFTGFSLLDSQLIKNNKIDQNESGEFEDIIESPNENVVYILVCGVDLSESLTDIIMVACYDLANNNVNVLQIPRDTFVGTDVPTGKVNAVYGNAREGESNIKALMRCINQKFGLPIDHYATVTIEGTEKIIDIVGGVDITLDRSYTLVDDTGEKGVKKTFEAGEVHFDGQWGTAFVRHRASYLQGDMGRIKAQRSFYAALLKKMTTLSFGQITNIVTSAASEISSDLTPGQMLGYAQKMKDLNLSNVKIMSVPGQSGMYRPTGQSLSYYSIHKSDYVTMLNDYFRPYETTAITADDLDITELHTSYTSGYDDFLAGGSLEDFDTQATTASSD